MPIILKTVAVSISTGLVLVFLSLSIATAQAQEPAGGGHSKTTGIPEKRIDGTWESLKPTQQKILAPLESDWDYMLPDSRKKWIQISNLYPKMSEQDQARLQSRMTGWSKLSQRDRRIARENYLTSLKFPAEKKVEAWSAYQKLSDEEKKKLAKAEENKKKPSAANAPTLQQHPITQKPALSLSTPESTGANSSDSATSASKQ